MGLRLVPRTINGIRLFYNFLIFQAVEKPRRKRRDREQAERMRREQAEREEANRQRQAEEIQQQQQRAYAREKGTQQALLEMQELARQKEYEHSSRMLALRERLEQISQVSIRVQP